VTVNEAVGTVATTVIDFDVVSTSPASSLTDSVTAYVPALAYVCCAVEVVADAASPKLHEYDWTVPSLSVEALASKAHVNPEQLDAKAAVGGRSVSVTV
jgi:hypothetical protein